MSLLMMERRMRSGVSGGASSGGGVTPPTGGGSGGSGSIAAKSADAAANSLMVNIHAAYSSSTDPYQYQQTGPGYADAKSTIVGMVQKLGARFVRDVWGNNNTTLRAALNLLHSKAGIRTLLIVGATGGTPDPTAMATDVQTNYGGAGGTVWAVSGLNEPDNVAAGVDWATPAQSIQRTLYQRFSALGIPVYSPPLAGTIRAQGGLQAYQTLGDLDAYSDGLDIHNYPGGYEPATDLDTHLARGRQYIVSSPATAAVPTIVSETGYDTNLLWYGGNPPAPEDIVTIYAPIHYAEHLWRGVRPCFYELYNRRVTATAKAADSAGSKAIRERSFGLIGENFIPKGEAVALGRVQSLLSDPGGAFTPPPLGATLTGVPSDVKQLVYGKRDGSYLVFLWRLKRLWTPPRYTSPTFYDGVRLAAPAGETVTLTLNQPGTVQTYRPSLGATSDQFGAAPAPTSSQSGTTFTAPVGTDLVILKILPQ